MKRAGSVNVRGWGLVAGTATGLILAAMIIVARADGQAGQPKARTGAELYQSNCARCHAERFAKEHTDAQWKTIMLHMRVRAQLTGEDAKKILDYLQDNN